MAKRLLFPVVKSVIGRISDLGVNVPRVQHVDEALRYFLECEGGEIHIRNALGYLITLGVRAIEADHNASVIKPIELVGVVMRGALHLKAERHNGLTRPCECLLLLCECTLVARKHQKLVNALEI